ncbi:MAG TPA: hypothetical protein VFA99_07980 [Acidobacteriaceae bacterium]|nr:hypothetical protein [Acidobacteriaceae bacterium]
MRSITETQLRVAAQTIGLPDDTADRLLAALPARSENAAKS